MSSSSITLHVTPTFNSEEAAQAAAEFVSSLDNLPGEVAFLLEEIKEKEHRINQLIGRISSRHTGLVKPLRNIYTHGSANLPPTSDDDFSLPIPPGDPIPTAHLNTKDQQAITKIQNEWGKIEVLQEEKCRLADRLEKIVSRARERGRHEWLKVGGMDLEEVEKDEKMGMVSLGEFGGGDLLLPPSGLGSGTDGRPPKKRKPNALPLPLPSNPFPSQSTPIIHPPSHSAMLPPSLPHSSRPSLTGRGSRHARHISTSTLSEDPDVDGDGEMDVEMGDEGGGDGEADDTLYCICHQKSFGEMIGCDNEECEYEWFHVGCVNMSGPAPDTWYCPSCVKTLGLASSDGKMAGSRDKKGRKK
ncbi:hypothetical protein BD324DRAFT_625532 [Kockovaella imperatae]|uniref:Chromatin modification-related protein n=1 Tax=Kockovaella imperatae TaxID=4999 RepID=A0A1Y1UGU1_9TREE|nr:hypothetical protein BD324DRAFT_625532 [Kockovaella imperatae]ORX37280.1 hypothetical protein BD324DRAFT_625532 [Kockovaella imperatae]